MAWMFSATPLATGRSWLRDCEQSESFGRLCEWFASRIFTVVGDFPQLTSLKGENDEYADLWHDE